MAREDAIQLEGAVVEVLPNTLYRVELANGHKVLAHVAGQRWTSVAPLVIGDKVTLELSPYDLSVGCIRLEEKIIEA